MKWLVFVCVALCLRHGEGGALKCIPGSEDRSCSSDLEEKEPQIQTSIDDSADDKSLVFECRPGSEWESNCHSCKCTDTGRARCRKVDVCESVILGQRKEETENVAHAETLIPNQTLSRKTRASQQDPPKACQPGQEFRMDCNKCLCDNEGQDFSCTRIDCNAVNNNPQAAAFTQTRSKRSRPGAPMAINQPWPRPGFVKPEQYGQISANSPRQKRDAVKESGGCQPGEMFARGCNMCRCSMDGHVAACTLKVCPKEKDGETDKQPTDLDPSFRCNAGEQFKQDCNDCTCSADGKSVFCTLRLCDMDLTPDI